MKIASVIGVGRYKRKFSYECKNRIHFDRRIICRSILALVLVSSILLSPASSQYTAFNWDKAFSKPQYLLHSTSWTEIMDSGSVLGPYQDDTWFLYTNKPEGGKIDIPKQGGKTTYSIDEISGPWTTPREVCQAANLMKTPSKNLWSYDLTATTEIFSCHLLGSSTAGTICEDRSSENLIAAPGSYPPDNCQYMCKDGFGPDEMFNCKPCKDLCIRKDEVPDPAGCVGGKCECICDDGEGRTDMGTCAPCYDICQSKNKNEIADATKCVGGKCICTCDTANAYKYNDQGVCVNDLVNLLTNALEGKDRDATALNLLPYLEDDNKTTRMMAIIGLRLLYPKAKLDGLPEDVREAVKRSINSKDAGLWMWTAE